MIVGFSGKARSGKDTAAKYLIEQGFQRRSFAGTLKAIACDFLEITMEDLEKHKDNPFPVSIHFEPVDVSVLISIIGQHVRLTPSQESLLALFTVGKSCGSIRELLQFIGTDIGTRILGKDVWINAAMRDLPELVVFTDVRFPEEKAAIEQLEGTSIYISRDLDSAIANSGHISENALDPKMFEYIVVNDGSIEDLHANVRDIVRR